MMDALLFDQSAYLEELPLGTVIVAKRAAVGGLLDCGDGVGDPRWALMDGVANAAGSGINSRYSYHFEKVAL